MNKDQIIDEVYNKYLTRYMGYEDVPSKELFLFEIKNNPEFSEKWGLKIEERELSLEERVDLMRKRTRDGTVDYDNRHHYFLDTHNVPTKQITLEYNNEKTYYYE